MDAVIVTLAVLLLASLPVTVTVLEPVLQWMVTPYKPLGVFTMLACVPGLIVAGVVTAEAEKLFAASNTSSQLSVPNTQYFSSKPHSPSGTVTEPLLKAEPTGEPPSVSATMLPNQS